MKTKNKGLSEIIIFHWISLFGEKNCFHVNVIERIGSVKSIAILCRYSNVTKKFKTRTMIMTNKILLLYTIYILRHQMTSRRLNLNRFNNNTKWKQRKKMIKFPNSVIMVKNSKFIFITSTERSTDRARNRIAFATEATNTWNCLFDGMSWHMHDFRRIKIHRNKHIESSYCSSFQYYIVCNRFFFIILLCRASTIRECKSNRATTKHLILTMTKMNTHTMGRHPRQNRIVVES